MLTPEQLGELRAKIDERHEALESEIHRDAARSRDEPYGLLVGEATESGDNATADLISDLDNAELTRDLEELRALETAQERIDAGSYGSCLDCGGEIEFERLLAQPAALRCFDCERVHERTYAHPSRSKL
ncbi:MAG: TraR/DksA C4-type zinc finger protein [Betaproteobacteria bacterium]